MWRGRAAQGARAPGAGVARARGGRRLDLDVGEPLREAGDRVLELELGRLAALERVIEHVAVGERAPVVNLRREVSPRPRRRQRHPTLAAICFPVALLPAPGALQHRYCAEDRMPGACSTP